METVIYSATGCIRCNIVKAYLKEKGKAFVEHDIRTLEGDAAFKPFYRENRKSVNRDKGGIFFPIFQGDGVIRQDAGPCLSWFMAGDRLDHAITPNNMGHGWTGGLSLSPDLSPDLADVFFQVMERLKAGGLSTFVRTNGNNPDLLARLGGAGLVDRLEFSLTGPATVYRALGTDPEAVAASMACLDRFPELRVITRIAPLDLDGQDRCITPEEAGQAAQWLAEASGVKTMPYLFAADGDDPPLLFKYRTAARRWQVKADILKDSADKGE
ncbi:MAG: hypothetical protein MI863_00160 [Desulfobacterales bacterium]|nr:hypothetical protein [Desulfobacterales bacterium]